MERKDRIDALGGAVLLTFSLLVGLNQVMIKLVNAGMQPVFQAGMRSACAFLPVLIFAILARRRLSLTDGSLWPGILAGVFFATEFVLLFQSVEYTSVARASVFFYTMPFWVALWAHFLIPSERLTPARVFGLVLAIGGIALALLRDDHPATEHALFGDILSLLGAMFWAAIVYLARMTKLSKASPEMLLLYQLAVSSVILLAAAPLFGPLIREMTPALAAIFAFQVLAVVCFGFLLWFWALKIYPASNMTSFSFLAPLFGVLFSWLILGEAISWTTIMALVLVAIGIVLVNRRARPGA
ncbi:MAG TPA: DMT family transporter [Thermohalobaculum sp.]|nr:DMT family transporter [Thermohalobaculum sp.]